MSFICLVCLKGASRVTINDMLDELEIHLKIEKNPNVVNLLGVCSSSDGRFQVFTLNTG